MSKGRAEKRNIISPENGGGTTILLGLRGYRIDPRGRNRRRVLEAQCSGLEMQVPGL